EPRVWTVSRQNGGLLPHPRKWTADPRLRVIGPVYDRTMKINRREFATTIAAGVTATSLFGQGPTVIRRNPAKPLVISSANGNKFKNGGDVTCVQKAFTMMTQGSDVLDALIAGVNIVQLDPLDD